MISIPKLLEIDSTYENDSLAVLSAKVREALLEEAKSKAHTAAGNDVKAFLSNFRIEVKPDFPDGYVLFWPSGRVIDCRKKEDAP